MIKKEIGNCLDIEQGIIVHGCNSHGIMRSGIAAEVSRRWPEAYRVYRKAFEDECKSQYHAGREYSGLPLGSITWAQVGENKIIVNAITQKDFGRDRDYRYVDYDAVHDAFATIAIEGLFPLAKKFGVHFPLIGCGLANGTWEVVDLLIEDAFSKQPEIEKSLWVLDPNAPDVIRNFPNGYK